MNANSVFQPILFLGLCAWSFTSCAATIIVANNSDSGAGSLRAALANANAGDMIAFAAGGLTGGQNITLTTTVSTGGAGARTSAFLIAKNVTIDGGGGPTVTLTCATARVFDFEAAALTSVSLKNLTLQGTAGDGNIGGAICMLVGTGNFTLSISNCSISGTNSLNSGGAIGALLNDNLNIDHSTINGTVQFNGDGSASTNRGGAIVCGAGTTTLANCTLTGTVSGNGGGVDVNSGLVNMTNCTVANCAANSGAGIEIAGGNLNLYSCTVFGCTASSSGGGVYLTAASSAFTMTNTIIGKNSAASGPDMSGSFSMLNYSILSVFSGLSVTNSTNIYGGVDPLLGTLQNNGGMTRTFAALPSGTPPGKSPVFGRGTTNANIPLTDQRGQPRQTPPCIGAFEIQPPALTAPASITAAVGQAFSGKNVGTFVAFGSASNSFTASIDWGDKSALDAASIVTTGAAAIPGTLNGNLTGGHTYATAGNYTVKVALTDANGVVGPLSFTAAVADAIAPTAALASAPDVASASAPTPYPFSVNYSDNIAIKAATLSNANILVTGANGFSQPAAFVSATPAGDVSPIAASYTTTLPGGLPAGTYSIVLQAVQVTDTSGNPAAAGSLGTFKVTDAIAPSAALASAADVTNLSMPSPYPFSVVFKDNSAVNAATLGNNNLLVTGPNGFSQKAAFVSATPAGNGALLTATYNLTPTGGAWTASANGAYSIALQAGQVTDTSGNVAAASTLGAFNVGILAFDSSPSATPNPATVGQPVAFIASASSPAPVTYTWSYGDGASDAGAAVSHAFSPAKTYSVSVVATNAANVSVSASITLTVNAVVGGAPGSGIGVLPGELDSDGDGFSDAVELAAGSDPNDPNSTPGNVKAPVKGTASNTVVKISKQKVLTLTGSLRIPKDFVTKGQIMVSDIGGFTQKFTLDGKGSGKTGKDTFKLGLKLKKGAVAEQDAKFKLTLNNAPASVTPAAPLLIVIGGTVFTK